MTDSPKSLLLAFHDAETSLDEDAASTRSELAVQLLEWHTQGHALSAADYRAVMTALTDAPAMTPAGRERMTKALAAERSAAQDDVGAAWYQAWSPEDDSAAAARLALRAGDAKVAAARLRQAGGAEHAALLAECHLVAGEFHDVLHVRADLSVPEGEDERLSWLEAIARCLSSREPEELVRLCRRGGKFYQPLCELEAYLLMLGLGRADLAERLSTPVNVQRRATDADRGSLLFSAPLDFAKKLATVREMKQAVVTTFADFATVTAGFRSLFQEMLGLAALARSLEGVGAARPAVFVFERYRARSLQASRGLLSDVWSLQSDAQPEGAAGGAVVTYQDGVAEGVSRQMTLLGTSVKIASVVLADRLRHMMRLQRRSASSRDAVLVACAEIIAKDLTKLRGGLQKLVQLGVGFEGIVPESVRQSLSQVQAKNFPIRPGELEVLLQAQLGRPVSEAFRSFRETPVATGSIAQVHHAVGLDGRELAVKVRIPKVQSMIATDFKGLARLSWFLSSVLPIDGQELGTLIDYWQQLSLKECDFGLERENLQRALPLFGDGDGIKIPRLAEGLQADAVLTSDFAGGESLEEFLRVSSPAERNVAGERMVRFVLRGLRNDFLKFDLDPSNFRFAADSLWVLDFGGMVTYDWASPQNLLLVIKALQDGRSEVLREHLAGLVTKPETYDFQKDLDANHRLLLKPFLADEAFRFTPEYARQVFYGLSSEHPNQQSIMMKPWWLPQSRIYWTLFSVLGRLGAEANWYRIAREEAEKGPAQRLKLSA